MQLINWSGRLLPYLILILVSACQSGIPAQFPSSPNLAIIPKVQHIESDGDFFQLTGGIQLIADSTLWNEQEQLSVFLYAFLGLEPDDEKQHQVIELKYVNDHQALESYQIKSHRDTITISSNSNQGIQHGISTLEQLILLNQFDGNYFIPHVSILDSSSFQHRGLLLDCSRHFFSVATLKKYIDLMAFYKMNVLHWHLTEDQAWRIAIDKYPKLESIASKRMELDSSIYEGIYSKIDIQEIVQYAAKRYITILPEIELPGHSQAAIAAYPWLSCTGKQVKVANDWGVFKEIYCAGNDSVFTFLEDVLTEVIDLFPSKYIHIGGDEAPKTRWEECSKCQHRIKTEGLEDEHELQSYFIQRIQHFLTSKGKKIIGWDEILEGGLAKGAIVQSWRGFEGGIEAAEQGNKVIMSPTSHAYLDYDLKSIDLEKIYNFHPIPEELDSNYHDFIIGGECNMWTEHVPDEETLDQKVFPRMLGMSEALWSSSEKDYADFNRRIQSHYPILEQLNVNYGEESIPFEYSTTIQKDSLFLVLTPSSELLSLRYWEKSEPSTKTTYTLPLWIDSTKTMVVQAYKKGKLYGGENVIPLSVHKALGKSVQYKTEYNQWYTGGGNNALVDGKKGTLDFRDGNWQGFWGTNPKIVIDLEMERDISEISLSSYQYSNSWIFIPTEVSFETSVDGENWEHHFPAVSPKNEQELRGKFIRNILTSSSQSIQTRYIRVSIQNVGKVPFWHEAAGSNAWVFIDEIQVK